MSNWTLSTNSLPRWITRLILLCCAIEVAIIFATIFLAPNARQFVYTVGAFWPFVLERFQGIYPGQPVVMFLTYGLLHGSLVHLGMNMVGLGVVGRELTRFISARQIFAIYAASQIGAALVYAWLSPAGGPMVGASGAVFGLAGAALGYAAVSLHRQGKSLNELWKNAAIFAGLNILLPLLVPNIAWEAHLGGALVGFAASVIWPVRQRR